VDRSALDIVVEGGWGGIRVVVAAILLLRRRRAVSSSVTRTGVSRHISQYGTGSEGVKEEERGLWRGRVWWLAEAGLSREIAVFQRQVCLSVVLVPRMARDSGQRGLYEMGRVGLRVRAP